MLLISSISGTVQETGYVTRLWAASHNHYGNSVFPVVYVVEGMGLRHSLKSEGVWINAVGIVDLYRVKHIRISSISFFYLFRHVLNPRAQSLALLHGSIWRAE